MEASSGYGPASSRPALAPLEAQLAAAGDAALARPDHRGGAAVDADLAVQRSNVIAHRVLGQTKQVAHLCIVAALADQPKHLTFAHAQRIEVVCAFHPIGAFDGSERAQPVHEGACEA